MGGRHKHPGRRERHHRERLAAATTAEEQFAAAVDWVRSAAASLPASADRARFLRQATQPLADLAVTIERSTR